MLFCLLFVDFWHKIKCGLSVWGTYNLIGNTSYVHINKKIKCFCAYITNVKKIIDLNELICYNICIIKCLEGDIKHMKKFARLMVLALVVAALAAIFAIPSQATAGPVLYVASNGTGDGKTPENPMGNAEGYDPTSTETTAKNAFVRALYNLQSSGGTLVIVGEVVLDTNNYYPTETGKTAAELNVPYNGYSSKDPDYNVRPTITVTSNYGGVDYRTQGAKLVLDHVASPSALLSLKSPGIWKDLNIEYKYDLSHTSYYTDPAKGIYSSYMLMCDLTKHVFDTGITCTSVEVITDENGQKKEVEGTLYPTILAGARQSVRPEGHDTDLTIKSGTWSFVYAAGYGHNTGETKNGTLKGNAKLRIEGGKIGQICGTGSIERPFGNTTGTIDITVTGGEIGDVYLTNGNVYEGPGITMTVTDPAVLTGKIHHSPIEGEILPECTVTVNGQPYVAPTDETTAPESTNTPATKPPTKPTQTTKAPTGTTAPATNNNKTEEGSNLTLIIIIAAAAVVIIGAVVATIVITKKKAKK